MFINLGNNNIIRSREIISIVDQSVVSSSSIMEEMMDTGKRQAKVIGSSTVAKSVVITNDSIYYSTLSVPTLKKRSSAIAMIKKFEKYSN